MWWPSLGSRLTALYLGPAFPKSGMTLSMDPTDQEDSI